VLGKYGSKEKTEEKEKSEKVLTLAELMGTKRGKSEPKLMRRSSVMQRKIQSGLVKGPQATTPPPVLAVTGPDEAKKTTKHIRRLSTMGGTLTEQEMRKKAESEGIGPAVRLRKASTVNALSVTTKELRTIQKTASARSAKIPEGNGYLIQTRKKESEGSDTENTKGKKKKKEKPAKERKGTVFTEKEFIEDPEKLKEAILEDRKVTHTSPTKTKMTRRSSTLKAEEVKE